MGSMLSRVIQSVNFALVATALLGCDAGLKDLTKVHRPAIDKNLAALPSIAGQVRTMQPLGEDSVPAGLSFTVDAFAGTHQTATAALCYAEDLANPDELGYVWGRIDETGELNNCASLLRRGHTAYDPAQPTWILKEADIDQAMRRFPLCAGYRYLLVIRTLEFLRPTTPVKAMGPFVPVQKDPPAGMDATDQPPPPPPPPTPTKKSRRNKGRLPTAELETAPPDPSEPPRLSPEERLGNKFVTRYIFQGGSLRAEVLVFELPSAKFLGGFRVGAQNTVQIDEDVEFGDAASAVEGDLRHEFRKALARALKCEVPTTNAEGLWR